MSWLTDITDGVAGLFEDSTDVSPSMGGNSSTPQSTETGYFGSTDFYNSVLNAGLGLAGVYFKQTGDKALAEQAAKQRMAEIAAAAKKGGGGGGGGGAGAAERIAKMNNLAGLYENWGALTQKGGESISAAALKSGELIQNPIMARAGRL